MKNQCNNIIRDGAANLSVELARAAASRVSVWIAAAEQGIVLLSFPGEAKSHFQIRLQEYAGGRAELLGSARFVMLKNAVEEFTIRMRGEPANVKISNPCPVLWLSNGPRARIWEAIRRVPYGSRMTYSALAAAAGNPKAVRAAAAANRAAPVPVFIPTHRVVNSSGELVTSESDPWTPVRERLFQIERVELSE